MLCVPRTKQTHTSRVRCSCSTCLSLYGQQRHAAQVAHLNLSVCSATCARKCVCSWVTASSSPACRLCCCWHPLTWHILIISFHSSKKSLWDTLLCHVFYVQHAAVLFLLWERLSTPEFEYVFTPRKASFPCVFLQTRVQSHGYTETRCVRSIVRMCGHINTPNAAGRREGSLGRHGTWLQHP